MNFNSNKRLEIYLYKDDKLNNSVIIDYCSFIKELQNNSKILQTFCMYALDFHNFKCFDKIIVYGKNKYAIFNKPVKNSNIIHYEVYTNNHIKINTYHKELRLAHNLYNLIIRGYFDLN